MYKILIYILLKFFLYGTHRSILRLGIMNKNSEIHDANYNYLNLPHLSPKEEKGKLWLYKGQRLIPIPSDFRYD